MQNEARIYIGEVSIVQVQREPLKTGESPWRVYDPAPLERVQELLLTEKGVVGLCTDGERVIDAHHADHPRSRNKGVNGISAGFTAHYDRLRAMYGGHLEDGIAGENIIISSPVPFSEEELEGLLVFENPDGSSVRMTVYKAMAPCNEFSHFARQAAERLDPEILKETLQSLDNGARGFALTLLDEGPAMIFPGAQVFLES